MATPFSPFVGRGCHQKLALKRRQSELPSDLIDWEAPEIPELEKQRIIYDDYIKELTEDQDIEFILNEQLFRVAHETIVDDYKLRVKKLEDEAGKERAKVNLLLGQIKMFEQNDLDNNERVEDLEKQVNSQQEAISKLEHEKENWLEERTNLQTEIENLNFKNDELSCESNHNLELYLEKKNEIVDVKKNLLALRTQILVHKNNLATNQHDNFRDNEE